MKTIRIKDYYGKYQEVPVSDELYDEWRLMQNEAQRVRKREMYHRYGTPLDEIDFDALNQQQSISSIEQELIREEEVMRLYTAISKLSPVQQRRIRMYMDNLSLSEIARRDGCQVSCVWKTINIALKKLRNLLQE